MSLREHHLRPRRRHPRRTRAEGGRAGRLVDGDPDEGRDRRRLRLRLARPAAHGDGLGGDRRARRPLLHRAARHPLLGVLRARVVRQVHAVPRGHALADRDPAQARGRARDAGATSTCCSTSATGSTASASARSATPTRSSSRSYVAKFRDEFHAHIDEGGCPFGGTSSLDHVLAPIAMHTPLASRPRCPRDRDGRRPRHRHDRRADGAGAEGHRASSRRPRPPASRSPSSVTSRGSAPPVGACRMCLVEVEGMPKLQAGCTLTAQDGMVVKTARIVRAGGRGAELDARVHPRQPPARLPRLRQGRRVPAAGPDVPLRARQHAHDVPEADVREADPDLAADRARPRALHPLLPLHALQRGGRRGRAARRDQPRRAVGDRDVRGRAVHGPLLRQRHRALPGRRADLDAVPLRGAPVGDPERADGLRALPRRLQHPRDDARGQGQAHPLAQPSRDRRGLALRQGPLRVRPPARRRPDRRAAAQGRPAPLRGARWDDALDQAEQLLRDGGATTVTALSGDETVEQAYALGKLLRQGSRRDTAVLPEDVPDALDGCRAPLSALRDAKTIAVLCDEPVVERAPIVELWLKAARRAGATITYGAPDGPVDALVTDDAASCGRTTRTPSTTCRTPRTAAASPTPGAPPATASPPTASRACSSSRATRPRPTPPCARWPPRRRS